MRDRSPFTQDFDLVDLPAAAHVEVLIDATGKLWVNVNDRCLLRCGRVNNIVIQDDRPNGPLPPFEGVSTS